MIFCKELNKGYETKAEMFSALIANKELIIGAKKAAIKFSDPVSFIQVATKSESVKADLAIGDYIYPVINTTNYMDSHGDVHLDGIWNVSVSEQKNKLYYIINHELELGKVISYPNDTEAMVKTMNWTDLGKNYIGTTEALIYKSRLTEKSNKDALNAILGKEDIQNSVRMQYCSMKLCINDTNADFKEEYANFTKYYPRIANGEKALEAGYFWAVQEAKIVKEGSAVLFGSNDATPILYTDPSKDSQKIDPQLSSQESKTFLDYLN